jgi:hypothetical protein
MDRQEQYRQCLDITHKANIEAGLLEPLRQYERIPQLSYPDIPFEKLSPPFGLLGEDLLTVSNICVTLFNQYGPRHDRLFKTKTAIDAGSISEAVSVGKQGISLPSDYNPTWRQVTHDRFPDLKKILMQTDCATIIEPRQNKGYMATNYKSKLFDDDDELVDMVIALCREERVKVDSKNDPVYRKKVRAKIYESIAWTALAEGTKHFAAASFLYNCTDKRFVIDVHSSSGIYSRIEKDDEIVSITHIMPQRREKFDEKVPDAWLLRDEEDFVLYCVEYSRNNNFSVTSPWVDIEREWIANPKKPSFQEGLPTEILPKKQSAAQLTE